MTLSLPVRRAAALTILAAVIWVSLAGIAVPVITDILDTGAANQRAAALLGRGLQLAAAIPGLQRRLLELGGVGDGGEFLAPGTPAMLAAAMQDAAEKVVLRSGTTLTASRTLPAETRDGFAEPGLDVDVSADLATLRRLLLLLDAARPIIRVEALSMRVPENGAVPLGPDAQPRYPVHLRLISFARPGAPAGASP